MSRFFDLVSKAAREMPTYTPRPNAVDGRARPQVIRLDSNENPFGPSPLALEAMRACLADSHLYPDDDCSELQAKIAAHHRLPAEQVMVTAGSTGMIVHLCQTLLAPGLNAVTSERSFVVYAQAVCAVGAELIETAMRNDGFDPEALLGAINGNTRIVFVANPNNPTGSVLDHSAIEYLTSRVPAHVMVVLDEAYYEFAAQFALLRKFGYSGSLDYLKRGANLVVLRTFSKAHGLAGLRVGYGLGPPELLNYCARMRSTYSVSSVAQAAAMAAMDDQAHINHAVENNAHQAQFLTEELAGPGFRVVPTSANFLYYDVQTEATQYAARLLEEGLSVRPLTGWGAPNSIRVSIGTPEQNRMFLDAVRKIAE